MRKLRNAIAFMLIFTVASITQAKEYVVTTYGAKGDGTSINTKYIQSAIDQAHKDGGGKVIIPAGIFLSGTLALKSNVELSLKKGAVLLGSIDINDYYRIKGDNALIISRDQHDISIS